MSSRPYSTDGFKQAWEYESRRGQDLRSKISGLRSLDDAIAALPQDRSTGIVALDANFPGARTIAVAQRQKLLDDEMTRCATQLQQVDLASQFKVVRSGQFGGKQAYKLADSSDSLLVRLTMRQVQDQLKSAFKLRHVGKSTSTAQLKLLLEDRMPKTLLRTDIQEFFESVPHKPIIEKLRSSRELDANSLRIILAILANHRAASNSNLDIGLPRGIGISAHLAEIYLEDVDLALKRTENLVFHSRYVDDIVVVTAGVNNPGESLETRIRSILKEKDLQVNEAKTVELSLVPTQRLMFSYLGYEVIAHEGQVQFHLTAAKYDRYKLRMSLSFKAYLQGNPSDSRSQGLLLDRIRYLSGNTRLGPHRHQALIGIFYSNDQLDYHPQLKRLDDALKTHALKVASPSLQSKLQKLSFEAGFRTKKFYKFDPLRIQKIVSVWKDDPRA